MESKQPRSSCTNTADIDVMNHVTSLFYPFKRLFFLGIAYCMLRCMVACMSTVNSTKLVNQSWETVSQVTKCVQILSHTTQSVRNLWAMFWQDGATHFNHCIISSCQSILLFLHHVRRQHFFIYLYCCSFVVIPFHSAPLLCRFY